MNFHLNNMKSKKQKIKDTLYTYEFLVFEKKKKLKEKFKANELK